MSQSSFPPCAEAINCLDLFRRRLVNAVSKRPAKVVRNTSTRYSGGLVENVRSVRHFGNSQFVWKSFGTDHPCFDRKISGPKRFENSSTDSPGVAVLRRPADLHH